MKIKCPKCNEENPEHPYYNFGDVEIVHYGDKFYIDDTMSDKQLICFKCKDRFTVEEEDLFRCPHCEKFIGESIRKDK